MQSTAGHEAGFCLTWSGEELSSWPRISYLRAATAAAASTTASRCRGRGVMAQTGAGGGKAAVMIIRYASCS